MKRLSSYEISLFAVLVAAALIFAGSIVYLNHRERVVLRVVSTDLHET